MFEGIVTVILITLFFNILKQEKRIKVQDRQFQMLLARLNELTGRNVDDFTSPIDAESNNRI